MSPWITPSGNRIYLPAEKIAMLIDELNKNDPNNTKDRVRRRTNYQIHKEDTSHVLAAYVGKEFQPPTPKERKDKITTEKWKAVQQDDAKKSHLLYEYLLAQRKLHHHAWYNFKRGLNPQKNSVDELLAGQSFEAYLILIHKDDEVNELKRKLGIKTEHPQRGQLRTPYTVRRTKQRKGNSRETAKSLN